MKGEQEMNEEKEIVGVNVTPSTATGSTANYGLPIFERGNKPQWSIDWNGSMTEIDRIMHEIESSGTANKSQIDILHTQLDNAKSAIDQLQGSIDGMSKQITGLESVATAHDSDIEKVKSDLIAQNTLVKTLTSNVEKIESNVSDLQNTANILENDANYADARIRELQKGKLYGFSLAFMATDTVKSTYVSLKKIIFKDHPELAEKEFTAISGIYPKSVANASATTVVFNKSMGSRVTRGLIYTLTPNSSTGKYDYQVDDCYTISVTKPVGDVQIKLTLENAMNECVWLVVLRFND